MGGNNSGGSTLARWHKTNLGTVCPHALELGQGVSATPGDAWRAAMTMTVPAQPTTHR
jgi:hypothetical protein